MTGTDQTTLVRRSSVQQATAPSADASKCGCCPQVSGRRRRRRQRRSAGPALPAEVERAAEPGGGAGVRIQRGHGRQRPLPGRPLGGEGGHQRQAQ